MRLRVAMWCAVVASACGGSDGSGPDAAIVDAGADAAVDAGLPDAALTRSLALTPTSHDFGAVALNCPASTAFRFTSTGSGSVGPLETFLVGSAEFQITADACMSQSLAPGQTCDVMVRARASSVGVKSATLTVAAGPVEAAATLTALGVAAASLTITPNLQNYGSVLVGQSSAPVTYTVTNAGGVPLGPLVTTITGADAASFAQVTDACTTVLNPGASCTTSVRFAPAAVGVKTATLTVGGAAPCGFASATLNGTAVVSDLTLTPSMQDFGAVGIDNSSSDVMFTATNTGGATTAALTVALTGTDVDAFTVAGGTCMSGATTLGPGATCTVLVHASPASAGPKTATLSVAPAGGTAAHAALSFTALIQDDIIVISPSYQTFGSVVVGSASVGVTFTVTNIGGVATMPLSVSRSGTSAGDFVVTADGCSGRTLASSAACTITAKFSPGTIGAKVASLDVVTSVPHVRASASLDGTGVTP